MAATNNTNTSANATSTEKKVPFLKVEENALKTSLLFTVQDAAVNFPAQTLEFNWKDADAAIREQAMKHGFNQKIRDAAAGFSGNSKKGIVSDPKGAIAAMQAVIDTLNAGNWNRIADNGASQIKPKLAKAIARLQKIDVEKASAVIESKEEDVWRKWWASELVQKAWTEIAAEEAAAKVTAEDTASLMEALNAAFQ